MRVGVVPLYGDPFRAPALHCQNERVVVSGRPIIGHNNIGIVLTYRGILERQNSPLVGVGDCRARGARIGGIWNFYAIQEAVPVRITDAWNEDRRIRFVPVHHMNDVVSDVIPRKQPIPHLFLARLNSDR